MALFIIAFLASNLVSVARAGLVRRDDQGPGPSGYLLDPIDGTVWDNTYGWGLGHVRYQGVSTAYHNGDITHVKTSSIDIYLQDMNETTTYYLAQGIKPDANSLVVDESFAIPYMNGSYFLVINETQECQSVDLPPVIFKSASPTVIIQTNATSDWPSRRSVDSSVPRLSRRDGPSGSLEQPVNGDIWDDTSGFGDGQVQYQAVNTSYYYGDITQVTTFSIDIWLELDDDSEPYYLARGIAPKNLTVDVDFQIPASMNGTYVLVVNETQECQSPNMPPIIFRSAAPVISILPSTVIMTSSSDSPPQSGLNIGALAGGVVGGVLLLAVIGFLIYLICRRYKKARDGPTVHFTRDRSGVLTPLPQFEPSFITTPFDLTAALGQPPQYSPTAPAPAGFTSSGKSRLSNVSTSNATSPLETRTSIGSSPAAPSSHGSSSSERSSKGYFDLADKPLPSPPSRRPSTLASTGHGPTLTRSDLERLDIQGTSRYPRGRTTSLTELRSSPLSGEPWTIPRRPSQPSMQAAEPCSRPLRSPTGPRAMTLYRPGDIIPTQFSGRSS